MTRPVLRVVGDLDQLRNRIPGPAPQPNTGRRPKPAKRRSIPGYAFVQTTRPECGWCGWTPFDDPALSFPSVRHAQLAIRAHEQASDLGCLIGRKNSPRGQRDTIRSQALYKLATTRRQDRAEQLGLSTQRKR